MLPMKKEQWDNDYSFYDDGSVEHFYDLSVKKYNIKKKIAPAEIPEDDKIAIIERIKECPKEWQEFVLNVLKSNDNDSISK